MTESGFDVNLLLSSEVKALLAERGLTLRGQLVTTSGAGVEAHAEDALLHALVAIEARMDHLRQLATMGEVSAGVLHEARNLLTGVVGLSMIRSNEESHAELLRHEAARCNKLLTTYLNSASVSPSHPEPVNARELLESITALLAYEARSRRCQLVTQVPANVPVLRSHANELRQVLLNLTLNAIQASPEGGEVLLSASYEPDTVTFGVEDHGPGVPEEMFEAIFEPFVSSKPPSHGTGLGLSTSRKLVTAIGGRLSVANASAGGALFKLHIPRETESLKSLPPGVLEPGVLEP